MPQDKDYTGHIDSSPNQEEPQHIDLNDQQQQEEFYEEGGEDVSPSSARLQYDECATKKLVGSRLARKQTEDDVKLLANRIALLKMEEQKAWKKIEETKKKAKDIMSVKQRNQDQLRIKEQRRREKELEERMLLERNQNMKNNIKDGIYLNKEQMLKKQFEEAERIKMEKREQAELVLMQKQQEQLKAASIKQLVRN